MGSQVHCIIVCSTIIVLDTICSQRNTFHCYICCKPARKTLFAIFYAKIYHPKQRCERLASQRRTHVSERQKLSFKDNKRLWETCTSLCKDVTSLCLWHLWCLRKDIKDVKDKLDIFLMLEVSGPRRCNNNNVGVRSASRRIFCTNFIASTFVVFFFRNRGQVFVGEAGLRSFPETSLNGGSSWQLLSARGDRSSANMWPSQ